MCQVMPQVHIHSSTNDNYHVVMLQLRHIRACRAHIRLLLQMLEIPGTWAGWEEWSSCSKSCNEGTRTRTRECVPLYPELGSGSCSGSDITAESCYLQECLPGK